MTHEAIKAVIVRFPVSTYDRLKAYQHTEATRTPYRVTIQRLITQAVDQFLNDAGVNTVEIIDDAVTHLLGLSAKALEDASIYPPTGKRILHYQDLLREYRRKLQPGAALRVEVEDHLARWDALG